MGRPWIRAAVSGLVLGLGVTVLLQQFSVWTLTVWTFLALPVAVAVVAGVAVDRLQRSRPT